MAYIQGQSRRQTSLFPVSLEELIPEDHRLKHQEQKLEKRIAQYLAELDEGDKTEAGEKIDRSAIRTTLAQLGSGIPITRRVRR